MPLTLREKMLLSLLSVTVGVGMIGIGMGDQGAAMVPVVYLSPDPVRYPDCGSTDGPPCVTWDDGDQGDGWYLVTGDGATLLPATPEATTDPVTRKFWYELKGN